MKQLVRILPAILLLGAVVFLSATPAVRAEYHPGQEQPKPYIIPGRVTVQFEDDVNLDNTAKAFGRVSFNLPSFDALLTQFEANGYRKVFPWRTERPKANSGMYDLTRYYVITFPEKYDVQTVVKALSQNPNVRSCEAIWAQPVAATPNDPAWSNQWAMEPPGPDPDFYDAWDIETGSDGILFGCIDTGVNYRHPDLVGNIWVNPGEDIDGDGVVYDTDDLNGIDDDGNGVVDDLIGYDWVSGESVWPGEDGTTPDADPNDFAGHGTHVAGIAAAMNNNGTNVTGAAGGWFGGHRSYRGARIMCLRTGWLGTDGNGYLDPTSNATAIDYATMMGAKVINASWGGGSSSLPAIAAHNAMLAGVTFCHAAGNDNVSTPEDMDNVPGVLSVASTTNTDGKSDFSNYGYWVDVSAPGSYILSTYSNHYTPTTAYEWGTSMACPMVSGEALLIWSHMPSLTKTQVDSIIVNTTDNIDAINPTYAGMLGTGRINAYKALVGLPWAKFTSSGTDGNVPLTVDFTDQSPYSPTSWKWYFGTGDSSDQQNPQYTYTEPGLYDVSLFVDDTSSLGLGEEHLNRYVWARADTCKLDSVEVSPGDKVDIPVYLHNTQLAREITFVFQLKNHGGSIKLDTFLTTPRTDYFESVQKVASDINNQRFAIRLLTNLTSGSNYLTPDTGAILTLRINVPSYVTPGTVVELDTLTFNGRTSNIITPLGDYWPEFTAGKVVVASCAHGDANCDGDINVQDLTTIVAYIFQDGPAPDPRGGDVNADGAILVTDVTYLVAYLFQDGPAPPE